MNRDRKRIFQHFNQIQRGGGIVASVFGLIFFGIGLTVIIYLWILIMIVGLIWFLLHYIMKVDKERKKQEKEFYESM